MLLLLSWAPAAGHAASQVVIWGYSTVATNHVLSDFEGVTQISAGYAFIAGLKTNGSIVGRWGFDNTGPSFPADATNISNIALSALAYEQWGFSLASRQDGTVVSLGYQNPSLIGNADQGTP